MLRLWDQQNQIFYHILFQNLYARYNLSPAVNCQPSYRGVSSKHRGRASRTCSEHLKKILESGKSPGEMWKKLFFSEWNNDIDMLYETNYFKVLENEKV